MKRWYSNVHDISGTNAQGIKNEVLSGNPVLYYGYSFYQKDTVRNYAKVIVGYKNNQFLVYDSLYYKESDVPMTSGKNEKYDKGVKHWLSVSDFNKEFGGGAIVIK